MSIAEVRDLLILQPGGGKEGQCHGSVTRQGSSLKDTDRCAPVVIYWIQEKVSKDDRSDVESSSDEEDATSNNRKGIHSTSSNGANRINGHITFPTNPVDVKAHRSYSSSLDLFAGVAGMDDLESIVDVSIEAICKVTYIFKREISVLHLLQ
ncbi:UNVERIFIED_CONTAM: hypothetical protein K2H54_033672 [Gekko kuhli]